MTSNIKACKVCEEGLVEDEYHLLVEEGIYLESWQKGRGIEGIKQNWKVFPSCLPPSVISTLPTTISKISTIFLMWII